MGKIKDISGQKFGQLTAIEFVGVENNKAIWLCKCDCGNTSKVPGTALRFGSIKSCGCTTKKHGMFGTRIYNVWHTMKERCYVKTQTSYKNYGAMGIKVCPEWQEFIPFMEWAYANGYDENAPRGQCTLDRIDPNGDYCPENCRLVSMSVQANNKTDNVYLEYQGITDTLSNHARRVGLDPRTVESRKVNGDGIDRMFRKIREVRTIQYKGKTYTVNEFCKKFKVSRSSVETRIFKNGESPEMALRNIRANKRKPMKRNRKVLQYDTNMNFLKEWDNINCICKELGLNRSAIGNWCLGNSKTSQGFIWEYK